MLVAILEGGRPTLAYLVQNNIVPDTVFYDFSDFEDYSSFFPDDTDILILIKGMTEYTKVKLYDLLDVIKGLENKKSLTLATNVDLGILSVDSYYYFDDPLEGAFVKVPAGKTYDSVSGKRKRGLLTAFVNYNDENTVPEENGLEYKREYLNPDVEEDSFVNKLHKVDFFKN